MDVGFRLVAQVRTYLNHHFFKTPYTPEPYHQSQGIFLTLFDTLGKEKGSFGFVFTSQDLNDALFCLLQPFLALITKDEVPGLGIEISLVHDVFPLDPLNFLPGDGIYVNQEGYAAALLPHELVGKTYQEACILVCQKAGLLAGEDFLPDVNFYKFKVDRYTSHDF